MSRLLQRAPITAVLLETLRAAERPVGDAEMPRSGTAGWVGQPNAEGTNFIAYSVLTPSSSTGNGGPLVDPGADVALAYVVSSYGVSRAQCEDQADLMRAQLLGLTRVNVAQWVGTPHEYSRRISTALVSGYGPIQRVGDSDPKVYAQSDSVLLLTTG